MRLRLFFRGAFSEERFLTGVVEEVGCVCVCVCVWVGGVCVCVHHEFMHICKLM